MIVGFVADSVLFFVTKQNFEIRISCSIVLWKFRQFYKGRDCMLLTSVINHFSVTLYFFLYIQN